MREITAERDAASASRNESRAALERALAAKAAAEKRAESAETSARDAVASLEAENAAHRKNLDEARAAASSAAQETRSLREELAAASQRADALAGEKSALAHALEEAGKRADAADTCAAPLRLETAAALARCKRGEDAARAMADRLAVARVAHAQAMAALNEVGARLGDESAVLEGGTDGVEGKTNATTPLVVASPAVDATLAGETEPPETFPVPGDDVELRSPAAPVGMDIMYDTEPPSEMPAKQGDASSDPIPETEAAAAGGAEPEPEPERDAAVREPDERSDADEPAADEPVSGPASAGGARRQSTVSSVLGGIVDAVADAVAAEVVAIDEAPEDAERDA